MKRLNPPLQLTFHDMTEGGFCLKVIRKYQDETAKPAPTIDLSRYDGGRVLLRGYR